MKEDEPLDVSCRNCNIALKTTWSLLRCGHIFCCDCMSYLIGEMKLTSRLTCPVCRKVTVPSDSIYYVDPHNKMLKQDESIEVKGRYSAKITAVIKCLLEIKKNDPIAKSVVFSGFSEIFIILEEAFAANGLNYICVLDKKALQERLAEFKLSNDLNILILPLQLGANELNLTEASNILLVEPQIIKSVKSQAISCLHRFGQNKNVTVHEFFIRGTIEEDILCKNGDTPLYECQGDFSSNYKLTVNGLRSLFG